MKCRQRATSGQEKPIKMRGKRERERKEGKERWVIAVGKSAKVLLQAQHTLIFS